MRCNMQSIPNLFKRTVFSSFALVLSVVPILSVSSNVYADQCTPPSAQTGVNRPVGADASTYTYNCATGLWENGYYNFDPNTDLVTPSYSIKYTYNPSTGAYDYTNWAYNAPSNKFVEQTLSTNQPPNGATVVGAPVPVPTPSPTTSGSNSISNTGPGSVNTINGDGGVSGTGSISNTGPNSTNTLNGTGSNNLNLNNNANNIVSNLVDQTATSGNSLVIGNTTAGDAGTGSAINTANVINLLQSASNALGGNAMTFVANINGNVNGDLLLDPSTFGNIQPASASNTAGNNNITVNNLSNTALNNTINSNAASGNATVAQNTTAGSATTGSAEAIANVVNLIDSAISSGHSFVGEININGNFNGNIVIPPNLVNQLIASNVPTATINTTGPNSTNTINNGTTTNNTNVNNTNNLGINNNVNANSSSGNATVSENTTGGNATSGNAKNSITAFNLTGSQVVGSNDILVFVNVSGTWVGMIINAPAGATAAELGGGISQNGNNNLDFNNTNNQRINNNINTNARSGNATVSENTTGGNATSGNAKTAVNLLNVENSSLNLSGWFGILFINVFGTWNGSFGPQNYFADLAKANANTANGLSPSGTRVFSFVPTTGSNSSISGNTHPPIISANISGGSRSIANSSLTADHLAKNAAVVSPKLVTSNSPHRSFVLPAIAITAFVIYVFGDRYFSRRSLLKK